MNWKNSISHTYFTCDRFVRFVIRHFIQDDCSYIASALAFTSLLAIVPLMSVGLAVLSSLPIFQGMVDPVQNFIFENFVPASGKMVQTYLQQFTSQVSKLSVWGLGFLLFTALLVLFTIEGAMNKIWRVGSSRRGVPAFLLYWAILSLAPVLLGLSLGASSYLFSLPLWLNHSAPSIFLHWAPFLLSLIGFTFLYVVVPNCPVKLSHALWGGLFSAVFFELAKQAFAYYLTNYHTYELLYGAFATVPIFFVWVYWVWIITLIGAEITYALSVHHLRRRGKPLDGFSHALLWLNQLWTAQQEGAGLTFNQLIDASNHPFAVDAEIMIQVLTKQGLIHSTATGEYRLNRDLSKLSLYDLTQLLAYRIPTPKELRQVKTAATAPWKQVFTQHDQELSKSLAIDLDTLFRK